MLHATFFEVLTSNTWLEKQDIGYAKLAHLAPQYGLCKTLLVSHQQLLHTFNFLWMLLE